MTDTPKNTYNLVIKKALEAIPIEFIEEQINKSTDINNKDEFDILYAGNLSYLIKLWKEKI